MTEFIPADHRDARRYGGQDAAAAGGLQAFSLLVAVLPGAAVALLGAGVVAFLLAGSHSPVVTRLLLSTATAAVVAVLGVAARVAVMNTRAANDRLLALRAASAGSQEDLRLLAVRIQQGERPALRDPDPVPAGVNDLFALFVHDLQQERHAAQQAVVQAVAYARAVGPDNRVEVFVNLARRMQSLLHREIQLLDRLEEQVEDPSLLKSVFAVDHLATRMRRQTESLAVLGGAVSRRQWSRRVQVHEVLRAAIAEVEDYARVKVVPPVPGTLQPGAVADVIHLIAELIENATKFSAPHTKAVLRAEVVRAGLAIDVEDRGLGIEPGERQRLNSLLASHGRIEVSKLIADGRIGLFVVSALARRHGIKVELQSNIFSGTQAIVILPHGLVDAGTRIGDHGAEKSAAQLTPQATAVHGRTAQSAPAGAANRPALPRRAVPPLLAKPPASPNGDGGAQAPAPPMPAADPAPQQQADIGQRPPLPQRGKDSHMARQLRSGPAAPPGTSAAGHIPDLMAAFRGGIRRGEEEEESRDHPGLG